MAVDITNLLGKVENGGTSPAGKLSASEFNQLISATLELQNNVDELQRKSVFRITQGTTNYDPIENVVTLPGADTTVSVLTSDNTNNIVSIDGTAKVHLRFTSVQGGADSAEIVSVQVQVYSVGEWVTKGTFQAATQSFVFDAEDPNSYTEYDISEYLSSGENQVRFQVIGLETGVTGRLVFSNIVLTSLYLVNQQNYNVPIDAAQGGFSLAYQVYGVVDKTLHIKISGSLQDLELTYSLGTTQYTTDNFARSIAEQTGYGILSHGVHTVTAWLTCDDGAGNTITSDVLVNRFVVINNETVTEAQKSQPYIMLQEIKSSVINYVQTKLCGYAVFVPRINDSGLIELDTEASLNIAFIISNYSEDALTDENLIEYLRVEEFVKTNTRNDLNVTVEIEPASESAEEATSYDAYLHVWRMTRNIDGDLIGTYDILAESIGTDMINVTVDNSESFSPTAGSTFLINPKIRNNTEANFRRILNARNNNEVIESVWEGFSGVNDGWVTSSDDNQKVLRVLAGQRLTIAYNPFAQFLTNPESSMTMEFDFKVRNITDPEDAQIIGINERNAAGDMIGLRLNSIMGYFLTTSNNVEPQQNWGWEEDVRVHVSININHSVVAKTGATPKPWVRVFIDGGIEREFEFSTSRYNEFCSAALSNGGIVIGSESADIDIYSIRCYTNRQLSSSNIVKNWVATLPTSEEKRRARYENDILDKTTGLVSATKVRAQGKRVAIWHGHEPYQYLSAGQKGYWEIYQYRADGTIDPDCSGTIGKAAYLAWLKDSSVLCLEMTGQGSTAKTYFWFNGQTKIKDIEYELAVALTMIHNSISVTFNGDNTVTLSGGNVSGTYDINPDGETINVVDGWFDSNGMYRGSGFQMFANAPLSQKMVNKINYASPMHSHLCGGTRSYNDLHTAIVGKNSLQAANASAMVAKYTEPFFYFVQESETGEPVYRGGSTFGPGKMDDVTWGFDKKNPEHADFLMIEGAENNYPLTDMRVPWDHKVLPFLEDDEIAGYGYPTANNVNIDVDKCVTRKVDGKKVMREETETIMKNAWNFLYWHNPRMTYYNNTYENFMVDTSLDTTMSYWLTQGTFKYCLFRYDHADGAWVNAGMWSGDEATGSYAVRNLQLDPITAYAITSDNQSNYSALNKAFIAAIAAHAKANIGNYFNVRSLQFHYAYVNFFIAGTDNCSKNTYYVLDPKTKLFELHQDDLDTIFATDNTGRQTKPYYIDRQHPCAEGSLTSLYEGGANVLFNLCELMYEDTLELQSMMHSIFTAMCSLVSINDDLPGLTQTQKTTPWGFLHKYFFSVQNYFPAVAMNEQARIRYEYPASLGYVSTGGRAIPPITQSIGRQLHAEKQYMKRRLVYAASYARWGDFEYATPGSVGLDDTTSSFGFQGYANPDGSAASYVISLTPHQYIYPTANVGSNTIDPHVRLAPGQTYDFNLGTINGDTGVAIFASNYYRSFGNVGNISCKADSTFTLQGKRLVSFVANPTVLYTDSVTGQKVPAFRPQQFVVDNATGLKSLSLRGCVGIKNSFDASRLIRVADMDLEGTSFTEVVVPESENLETLALPSKLTAVNIDNTPNLESLTLEGYENLTTIKIGPNAGTFNSYALAFGAYNEDAPVTNIQVENIDWASASANMIEWLLSVNSCKLTGRMAVNETGSSSSITFAMKTAIILKWGNVDDASSEDYKGLLMNYNKTFLTSINIAGPTYTHHANTDYKYSISPSSRYANNFTKITWGATAPALDGEISIDPITGTLHVASLSSESDFVTIQADVECFANGSYSTLTGTKSVGIYDRKAELGDYVYADGSFSDSLDLDKTVVGICFYINPEDATDRRMVALTNIMTSTAIWGLFSHTSYPNESLADIVLADNPEYNVYDIVTIANITSTGMNTSYVTDENYRDETDSGDVDGFKVFAKNTAAGDIGLVTLTKAIESFGVGEVMPIGKQKTLQIIEHRNNILNDSGINLPIPAANQTETETENLTVLLNEIVANNGDVNKYKQFYYPAASYCYAYQPTVTRTGEVLSDKFKAHQWYLPSAGELARMYWHASKGYEMGVDHAIFARAVNEGILTRFTQGYYWASSEYDSCYSWGVGFSSGGMGNTGKYGTYYVRAVAAF